MNIFFDYKKATVEEIEAEIKRLTAVLKQDKATLKAHQQERNEYDSIYRDDKAVILKSQIKVNTNTIKRYKEHLSNRKAEA